MFLHVLNDAQKRFFVVASRRLCALDDVPAKGEQRFMEHALREMGTMAPPDDPGALQALLSNTTAFDTDLSKRIVMLELCGLAASDGIVSRDETGFLADVAHALGLDNRVVTTMAEFSMRRHTLVEEGRQMVLNNPQS